MAHGIPYVATATVAEPHDLERKVETAMGIRGPRYIHVFVPCPLGWGSESQDTIKLARLVKETGLFPVFEAFDGEVGEVSKIRRRTPVEEYLKLQRRYAHLFGENGHPEIVERLQAIADRNIREYGLLADDGEEVRLVSGRKPYAITLDVGSSLANHTGSWRDERAVYVDRMPPCNDACPAGENIQAWLYEAEEGGEGYERAWRKLVEENPFPAIMGRVCYHPCEDACNRGQLDEAVGIHAVERFLGDEAIRQRLADRGRRRAERQAGAGRRRRPLGALRRLPPDPRSATR